MKISGFIIWGVLLVTTACWAKGAYYEFGPEELIDANGTIIQVPGYSVPSLVDWNSDGLPDLMVGHGGGEYTEAKIRIYLNSGTISQPLYQDFFFVTNAGTMDLIFPAANCMGCFPRLVCFDNDEAVDLLVGLSDGSIRFFRNWNIGPEPYFNGYQQLKAIDIDCGCHNDIDASPRATLDALDYSGNGKTDLIVGGMDGRIRPIYNERDTGTLLLVEQLPVITSDGADLRVATGRSSPIVFDLDGDGLRDLICGNTAGQMLFYKNIGLEFDPVYDVNVVYLTSEGAPIDLAGSPRSRPSLCYWPDQDMAAPADAYPDLLIGAGDGKIHLFRGQRAPEDLNGDAVINLLDWAHLANRWGETADPNGIVGDLNQDHILDFIDVFELCSQWGQGYGAQGYQKLHPIDPNETEAL